jgi:putative (di)nucleoside polyphosphate hydrolase
MSNQENYRSNVAAIILKNDYPDKCEIFLAKRICDNNKSSWQFPQGGIDNEESAKEALFRELKEEIGTNDVEILCEHPEWISYKFPKHIKYKDDDKMRGYVGQTQKYFLVKLKKNAKINIHTQEAEFSHYKFVNVNDVLSKSSFVKRKIYSKVIGYFKEKGYF